MEEPSAEEILEAASLAVASATISQYNSERSSTQDQVASRPPPPPAVRAVLLIQAWFRRRQFLRGFGSAFSQLDEEILELAPRSPPLAISLHFCRRLRSSRWFDIEKEATLIAGLLNSQASKITMREVSAVVQYYEDKVPAGHMSLQVLSETLDKLVIAAQEALQEKVAQLDSPADVIKAMEDNVVQFQVPPEREERVLAQTSGYLQRLCRKAEQQLRAELAVSSSTPAIDAVMAKLERLFGPQETEVVEEIKVARLRRVQFLEMELETRWSRPFAGPLPPHSRAARRYQLELGDDNPKVQAFVREEIRHAAALESELEIRLFRLQSEIREFTRRRLEARAKSTIQELDSNLAELAVEVQEVIDEAIVNIGPDNPKVIKFAKELLSPDAHAAVFALQAERCAENLRAEIECAASDKSPEAGDRRRGVAQSLQALLNALSPHHHLQASLREEFVEQLAEIAVGCVPVEPPPLPPPPAGPDGPFSVPNLPAAPNLGAHFPDFEDEEETQARDGARAVPEGVPAEPPLSGRSSLDDEDLWRVPAGFEKLECADPVEVLTSGGKRPNGGMPDLERSVQAVEISNEVRPDESTMTLFQTFGLQAKRSDKNLTSESEVMAVISLDDLSMDVVQMHSEAVMASKISRSIADAAGVPKERVKVTGLEPDDTGSVRVLLQILEPTQNDPEPEGGKELRPEEVLDKISEQVDDPNSDLRCSEVGPFFASAHVERSMVPGVKVQVSSMASSYMAARLTGDTFELPGSPKKAWATPNSTGDFSQAGGLAAIPDTAAISKKASETISSRWGSSRLEPASLAAQMKFRTTCPHAGSDDTTETWALPYEKQPIYTFYDKNIEEFAQEPAVKLPANKRKFAVQAAFHLTRHPASGTDVLKGKVPPAGGVVQPFAADSWLDEKHLGMQDPTLRPGDVNLKDTAVVRVDQDQDLVQEQAIPDSPTEGKDSPVSKKKKKGKGKASDTEPEPEASISVPSTPVPNSEEMGSKKMKKGKTQVLEVQSKAMESPSEQEESDMDTHKTRKKTSLQKQATQEAKKADKATKVVEEVNAAKPEGIKESPTKNITQQRSPTSSPTPKGRPAESPKGATAKEFRKRPATAEKEQASPNKMSKSMTDLSAITRDPTFCWAGMYGGMSGTGLRNRWKNNDRLPELVGKPSANDLKTPAYVRMAYRHGTVNVGPPYRVHESMHEQSPAWTAMRVLDATIAKQDWERSYSRAMREKTQKLGPQESIRTICRSVSLPRFERRSKANAGSDRPPPKEAWSEASESEQERAPKSSIKGSKDGDTQTTAHDRQVARQKEIAAKVAEASVGKQSRVPKSQSSPSDLESVVDADTRHQESPQTSEKKNPEPRVVAIHHEVPEDDRKSKKGKKDKKDSDHEPHKKSDKTKKAVVEEVPQEEKRVPSEAAPEDAKIQDTNVLATVETPSETQAVPQTDDDKKPKKGGTAGQGGRRKSVDETGKKKDKKATDQDGKKKAGKKQEQHSGGSADEAASEKNPRSAKAKAKQGASPARPRDTGQPSAASLHSFPEHEATQAAVQAEVPGQGDTPIEAAEVADVVEVTQSQTLDDGPGLTGPADPVTEQIELLPTGLAIERPAHSKATSYAPTEVSILSAQLSDAPESEIAAATLDAILASASHPVVEEAVGRPTQTPSRGATEVSAHSDTPVTHQVQLPSSFAEETAAALRTTRSPSARISDAPESEIAAATLDAILAAASQPVEQPSGRPSQAASRCATEVSVHPDPAVNLVHSALPVAQEAFEALHKTPSPSARLSDAPESEVATAAIDAILAAVTRPVEQPAGRLSQTASRCATEISVHSVDAADAAATLVYSPLAIAEEILVHAPVKPSPSVVLATVAVLSHAFAAAAAANAGSNEVTEEQSQEGEHAATAAHPADSPQVLPQEPQQELQVPHYTSKRTESVILGAEAAIVHALVFAASRGEIEATQSETHTDITNQAPPIPATRAESVITGTEATIINALAFTATAGLQESGDSSSHGGASNHPPAQTSPSKLRPSSPSQSVVLGTRAAVLHALAYAAVAQAQVSSNGADERLMQPKEEELVQQPPQPHKRTESVILGAKAAVAHALAVAAAAALREVNEPKELEKALSEASEIAGTEETHAAIAAAMEAIVQNEVFSRQSSAADSNISLPKEDSKESHEVVTSLPQPPRRKPSSAILGARAAIAAALVAAAQKEVVSQEQTQQNLRRGAVEAAEVESPRFTSKPSKSGSMASGSSHDRRSAVEASEDVEVPYRPGFPHRASYLVSTRPNHEPVRNFQGSDQVGRRFVLTNSGATRQQVSTFAQSLTSSIFRASHERVATRFAAQNNTPVRMHMPPPPRLYASGTLRGSSDGQLRLGQTLRPPLESIPAGEGEGF